MKELFRNHDKILKPSRESSIISNSLSNAIRIPILISAPIVKKSVETPDEQFYDAPDHFSDDDDDEFDEEQAPEDDVTGMVIKFHQLEVWNNSEDNEVEYILPPNYGKKPSCESIMQLVDMRVLSVTLVDGGADWIGVYRESFTGFDEYLGYEYTSTPGERPSTTARMVKIDFSASIDLPLDGKFVFLYFQSTGLRGFTSMMGISDPFHVVKRIPSPRPDDID